MAASGRKEGKKLTLNELRKQENASLRRLIQERTITGIYSCPGAQERPPFHGEVGRASRRPTNVILPQNDGKGKDSSGNFYGFRNIIKLASLTTIKTGNNRQSHGQASIILYSSRQKLRPDPPCRW
eukprot:jgi/Mesvir1/20086/Mv25406-RA.1